MDLTPYLGEFLLLYSVNFLNLVSPGAGFTITVRNSLIHGRTVGLMTALGIVTSSFIHKTYSFLGFGLLIARTPWLFYLLKYAGAAYLVFLGIQAFWQIKIPPSHAIIETEAAPATLTTQGGFWNGFFTDMLNPQASICFIVLLSQTVHPSTPLKVQLLYGLALILTSLCWYTLLALSFSQSHIHHFFLRARRWLEVAFGSILIWFGVRLALISLR